MDLARRLLIECNKFLKKKHLRSIRSGSVISCGFRYQVEFRKPDGSLQAKWDLENLMPLAARQQIMSSAHGGASQVSSFYIGVYGNNRAPLDTDTPADLPDYGEISAFDEGSRQLWNKGALIGSMYDSSANPTVLTASETVTAYGVFMSTVSTFGSTAGYLWSVALAPTPETVSPGSTLRIPASVALESGG